VIDEPRRTTPSLLMPGLLLGVLVLMSGLYVAAYFLSSDHIPRGTTVEGIAVGGMSSSEAERRLGADLVRRADRPVVITANGERAVLRPQRIDLQVDVPATVERAGAGRSWDPRRIWDYFVQGGEVDAVASADQDALQEAVDRFAARADVPAVDGRVDFERGAAVPRYPDTGSVIQRARAATVVGDAFLSENLPAAGVELPTEVVQPTVTRDAVRRAMNEFAEPAMSGPVDMVLGDETVQVQPEDFSPALSMRPVGAELQPDVDKKIPIKAMEPQLPASPFGPRNARVTIKNGKPKVLPSKAGVRFDLDAVTEPFLEALTRRGTERSVTVKTVPAQPDLTTAEARDLRITERVSRFTTNFPHSAYRNVNLGRAAELIDGTILQPGETFSFNDVVGERTEENGFTKGFIISDGVFREDFGGGVSQVATTTFNAAFFAGLEDVEHKPHSFYIDRYPVGREATVAWPTVDLRFKNTTPYGVLIQASIDPSSPTSQGAVHVSMWSTKYWTIKTTESARYNVTSPKTRQLSGPDCVPNVGYGGFDIDVERLFYRYGSTKLHHRETMHTTYTPSDTVVCS
jgi:vancomycin resistance protein YoaR